MKLKDEHVMEACGRARVVIRNGHVTEVGPTTLTSCPLARKFSKPVVNFTQEEIRSNIEDRISKVGMFTNDRQIMDSSEHVTFGTSEAISINIRKRHLDCAVLVCDGAGTIIITSPEMVQGIGGRMSGLVKTSPIPQVIERVKAAGGKVLAPKTAAIDQLKGVKMANRMGFKRIAVTVASAQEGEVIRSSYPNTIIFGVHTTGIAYGEARKMVDTVDVISACASKWVRELAGKKALIQVGASVPVFALTMTGKELILNQIREIKQQLLVKTEKLPYTNLNYPEPLS